MKIVGDSIQEGIPTPENPKEIKHEPKIVVHTIDGKRNDDTITEDLELKEGDFIFKSQKDNKWYLRRRKQMDEEEKAIERCKELIKPEHSNWIGISSQAAIETVLNLIDKQQKEIEHQKEKRENQKNELAILNEKQKEFNKMLNTIKSYKGQFKRQEREIDKQNKVIDLILNDYMTINEIRTMMDLPHSITTADELKEVYFRKVEEDVQ